MVWYWLADCMTPCISRCQTNAASSTLGLYIKGSYHTPPPTMPLSIFAIKLPTLVLMISAFLGKLPVIRLAVTAMPSIWLTRDKIPFTASLPVSMIVWEVSLATSGLACWSMIQYTIAKNTKKTSNNTHSKRVVRLEKFIIVTYLLANWLAN